MRRGSKRLAYRTLEDFEGQEDEYLQKAKRFREEGELGLSLLRGPLILGEIESFKGKRLSPGSLRGLLIYSLRRT